MSKNFSTEDFQFKDFIGEWVHDVRIEPTLEDVANTVKAFDSNPYDFEFDDNELESAMNRVGITEDDVGIYLSTEYFLETGFFKLKDA
jgi:hypothetical protein